MDSEVLYLSDGEQMVPVTLGRRGKKLSLSFPFRRGLVDEVKCMRGAVYDAETKGWEVTDCRRNWMQLEGMQATPDGKSLRRPAELKRYFEPRLGVKPTRAVCQPHQVSLFDFGASVRRCGWFAEQGTGKTLAAIELAEWAVKQGFKNWWYVAPKPVLKAIALEVAKWKCTVNFRFLNYDILDRETEARFQCRSCKNEEPERFTWKKAKAVKHADGCGEVVEGKCQTCGWYFGQMESAHPRCRNCESVTEQHHALWKPLPLFECPDGVFFDESSRLKNGGATRTQAAQYLADRIRDEKDGFVIEMTGTPAPHDPCDLHSEIEIICPGLLRESTRAHLERRLAILEQEELPDGRKFGRIVGWKENQVKHLHTRLKPVVEVHMAKDVLTLPELTKEIIRLPVSDELERAARMAATSSINAAMALNKLRQLSDGFQYGGIYMCSDCHGMGGLDINTGDEHRWVHCSGCEGAGFLPNPDGIRRAPGPKDDQLREDLGYNEEVGRIVIYAGFHASVDRCVDICLEEGWDVLKCDGRGWLVKMQNGKDTHWTDLDLLKEMDLGTRTNLLDRVALVGHPASVGLGQNLTAARENIFFSNDFNAESRMQAEKRSHRNGQTRGVRIKDYCLLPTDEFVLRNLETKRGWQNITLGMSLEEVIACL